MSAPSLTPKVSNPLHRAFFTALKRDLQLVFRNRSALFNPVLFILMVASLFPFGVGADKSALAQVAPGIIWVAGLLSTLLALEHLFKTDYDDGSLEQLLLSPHPSTALLLAKVVAHWLITGLILVLVSPLLGMLLHLPSQAYGVLALSLLLGTPTLSLIGAIGAGLTVGITNSGLLLSLLIIPLYIPVLIFGASAVHAAAVGLPHTGQLYFLAAALVFALCLAPFAIAAAIKVSLQ